MQWNIAQSEAFGLIEEMDRIADPHEIVRRMRKVIGSVGLQHIVVGNFPRLNERFEACVLVKHTPGEWFNRYVERGYFTFDPMVARMRASTMPFAWHVDQSDYDGASPAGEVMQGRREFGTLTGFAVPVLCRTGSSYVWMTGKNLDLSPRAKASLHLLALYAFRRLQDLLPSDRRPIALLTRRECEVLTWAAEGKSAWEIGEILNIAKRTVDGHTQTAARKLGAANRTQAVAHALRDRLIAI